MSSKIKKIAIYSNLPSGGASELEELNFRHFKKFFDITRISDKDLKPKNIFHYLYICLLILPKLHKHFSKNADRGVFLLAYHSWLTKSPHILRYSKVPKVYVCHEPMREYYDDYHEELQTLKERVINFIRLPIKIIDRVNMQSSNITVIANSKFSKTSIMNAYGVTAKVIYPGIDLSEFSNANSSRKKNQIISVGSINKLKRFEFLVEVVSKIDSNIRPSLLLIGNGGDSSYIKSLKQRAHALGVNLTIKTLLTRKELILAYLESKIFIYAPINEPFGIVVEEALAAGLPIVAYKHGGGYAEILSNRNGKIINKLDSRIWKREVEYLLTNDHYRSQISVYNREYVRKYSALEMNKSFMKIFESL